MATIILGGIDGNTSESGYVVPWAMSDYQRWADEEKVPDLQWPAAVRTYRRMWTEDSRMASVFAAIWLPILRTPWRIDPNGAKDEHVEFVARQLNLPLVGADDEDEKKTVGRSKGRFSFSQHLRWALRDMVYGHSAFEQVYDAEREPGRLSLRKLAPRPQHTLTAINVAQDGGLESIEQMAPAGNAKRVYAPVTTTIPVSQLVMYVNDMEPGIWTGRSLMRPAYKHWLLKDELIRIEAAAARRNGMGLPVATTAPGADSGDPAKVKKYQAMASQFQGGTSSGVGLPEGAKFELLGVQGNLPDLRMAIEYHDKQMALSGLAHFLNLERGGSYAMASVQSDTFVQSVQTYAEAHRDTFNEHVIEDLVDVNFGTDANAPRLVFDEIGSRQDLTAAALKTLVDAGVIRLDRTLEEYTRQQYGMPAKDTPKPGDPGYVEGIPTILNTPPTTPTPAPPAEPGSESVVNQ